MGVDKSRKTQYTLLKAAVAGWTGFSVKQLVGKGRKHDVSHARALAMYLARTVLSATYEEIGWHFNRHHTSVMAAVRRVEGWRENPTFDQRVLDYTAMLRETVLR